MTQQTFAQNQTRFFAALVSVAGLVILLMWMQGVFGDKVQPGTTASTESLKIPASATAVAERRRIDEVFAWPGTVTARIVTQIAPKVPGRILEISVRAGDQVKHGQILVKFDETEIRARLGQTRAALSAAEAEAERARLDAQRVQNLYHKEAATRQALDTATAAARAGEARVRETRDAIRATESLVSENLLKAPFDGVIVQRLQEPGDVALPGTAVLTLQQPRDLRLESAIPAQCASQIRMGDSLRVRLAHADQDLRAQVEEIQPATDPATRTILIKARLPETTGLQPGAFGWLYQACGEHEVLLLPASAISRIGQLESVRLLVNQDQSRLRHVRTGKRYDGQIEILSGLTAGDRVLLPEARP